MRRLPEQESVRGTGVSPVGRQSQPRRPAWVLFTRSRSTTTFALKSTSPTGKMPAWTFPTRRRDAGATPQSNPFLRSFVVQ
jgi:hypothetical protein